MKKTTKLTFQRLFLVLFFFSCFVSLYGNERGGTSNLSYSKASKGNEKQANVSATYNVDEINLNQQLIKVQGKVVDEKGEPLIDVAVFVKNTTNGTTTDINGEFSINVESGAVLEFSYLGFANKQVTITSSEPLTVVMSENTNVLDELVVTALGIKRSEKALSYNVQKLNNDEFATIKDANFINGINGKIAGVNIQRSASGVGGSTRVVMRGNKSITGDNNVLYVIDGIPISNSGDRSGDGTGFGGGASGEGISNLNPDDIESINVLTGPSAAALYGASAANGVILINTKKGQVGKARVNFSSSVEMSSPFVLPEFQDRYGNNAGSYLSWGDKLAAPSGYSPRDYFQTGTTFNNSFNFSTGTEKNQTFFSAAAVNSDGIVQNNKYHRYNVTLRNTAKFLNDKLTLDLSASYVREFSNNMISYGTYFNPIVPVYLYPRGENFDIARYFEAYDPVLGYNVQQWAVGDFGMDIQNPYWTTNRNVRPNVKDRYMLSGTLTYQIMEGLNIAARARLDNTYSESEDKRYASTISTFAKSNGYYAYSNESFKQKYSDLMINFNRPLSDSFNLQANAGISYEEYDPKSHGYGGQLIMIPNKFTYNNIDVSNAAPSQGGGNGRYANFAAFVSAELAYKSMLFLTATGRADRPSKLAGASKEWVLYPSVGLSAVITEMLPSDTRSSMESILGYLKVRASYTEVGSPIPFTGLTKSTLTHDIVGGVVQPFQFYPLDDFKPEKTRSFELGLDSRWIDNTVSLGVTLYKSNTFNQLLRADMPDGSGYNYMYVQAGNVENKGIELSLGYDQTFGAFGYNTTLTATANRNKIIKLASNVKNPISGEMQDLTDIKLGRFRLREGGEMGDVYSEQRIMRDDEGYVTYNPGTPLTTETVEPYKLGSVNSKWNFGWRNGFSFKGVNLNVLFTARLGGIAISKTQAALDKYGVSKVSAEARDLGYVKVGNINVLPKDFYDTVYDLDSYNVYSATNVRLQELSLSYTLPEKWFKNVIKNLTVSAYGTNLWMIYNKAPFDPELTASTGTFGQGYDYFMLPSLRTFGFGLKIGF